jgi:hypothetical protein
MIHIGINEQFGGEEPIILMVTPTPPVKSPKKFIKPDQTTACEGFNECV